MNLWREVDDWPLPEWVSKKEKDGRDQEREREREAGCKREEDELARGGERQLAGAAAGKNGRTGEKGESVRENESEMDSFSLLY